MRILQVINNLGSGGAERLVSDLTLSLNKQDDIEIDILLLTEQGSLFLDDLRLNGINIFNLSIKNVRNPMLIKKIVHFIDDRDYDIVHSHLFPTQYWVAISGKFSKKKPRLITTEHSTFNSRRKYNFFRVIDKRIYKNYDKVISISESTQNNLISWISPSDYSKFIVINNGVDTLKFERASQYPRDELSKIVGFNLTKQSIRLILMVARFSEAKDQKTVIKAINLLDESQHLLLVGEGDLEPYYREYVERLNLKARVHFLGKRNDIERLMKSVDIIVLSSKWEGFGLTAVEGMAAGKPVVISDIEGLRDVVNDKELQFKLGDFQDLSTIISKLLEDQNFYNEKSKYSIERAKHFDIKQHTYELISMYRNVLNS